MGQPLKIAILGRGAIARYVFEKTKDDNAIVVCAIISRSISSSNSNAFIKNACPVVTSVAELPAGLDLVADCSGHSGLAAHGAAILSAGIDLITISTGALCDKEFASDLADAASAGNSQLKLLSGAIGGIDLLSAGRMGNLYSVKYTGRKPPKGWLGSPAETICDLNSLEAPVTHFVGTARQAALLYPKNANVAATVGLAGLGLDETQVELIADPGITKNIHEIHAVGAFGKLHLNVEGEPLAENPKSSALAAMSIVSEIRRRTNRVRF